MAISKAEIEVKEIKMRDFEVRINGKKLAWILVFEKLKLACFLKWAEAAEAQRTRARRVAAFMAESEQRRGRSSGRESRETHVAGGFY